LFVAAPADHVAGQEYFLFSWRLVACDLVLALYLLAVSFFVVLLGADITTNVVTNALFR
jgi:hypothetical protein